MAHAVAAEMPDAPNHPLAKWMALIAGLSHNMVIGCLMGSFSVMLASVEERLNVSRELSSVGGILVIFGSALFASIVGPLMARHSLRLMMFIGALLSLAGYLVLAFTESYPLYVFSYALLFGPSMAIAGSVGPATLVTRWFNRNRGLALGLVHLSIVVAIMPVLCNWVLETYGAQATYLMLAAVVGVTLVPFTLLIRDHPPVEQPHAPPVAMAEAVDDFIFSADPQPEPAAALRTGADGSLGVGRIMRTTTFWALAITAGAVITSIMVLTFNMIPLAESLGIDRSKGALLASIMAFSGMAGSILFGWVADRIGGARGLALLAFNCAVLMGLLLLDLPYAGLVVVIGLLGLHGAGMVPNISRALAHSFGPESFSRAFGVQSAISVPFTAVGLLAMGAAFTGTGSYGPAILGVAIFLLATVPLTLLFGRRQITRA